MRVFFFSPLSTYRNRRAASGEKRDEKSVDGGGIVSLPGRVAALPHAELPCVRSLVLLPFIMKEIYISKCVCVFAV